MRSAGRYSFVFTRFAPGQPLTADGKLPAFEQDLVSRTHQDTVRLLWGEQLRGRRCVCRRGSCCCAAHTHVRTTAASSSDSNGNRAGSGSNASHHFRLTFPAERALRTGIGYSWQMCGDAYVRPPALDLDYGTSNAITFRCFR